MTRHDFERQYKELYMPLGMYALRIIGNVDKAEDVVQNAFESAWEYITEGKDISNFKAFMYRSVRNAALLSIRSERISQQLDEAEDVSEEEIDTSERDAKLWKAIDNLPKRCREIFLMSKRDGMSHAEIAEELDISVKTVENQITKAFSSLREELKGRSGKVFFLPFL